MKNLLGYLLVIVFALGTAQFLTAALRKEARVTAVIKDVRVLGSNKAARAAALNDTVVEGNAVRTGGDSRAELTFSDQTLSRIGENSVFTFGDGAKEFDLSSGAMLLAVPKSSGTTRVNIGAATAAVSGFTALFEKGKVNKFLLLEGSATFKFKGFPGDPCRLESGQMFIWPEHPIHCPQALTFDVSKVMKSAKLITKFPKLPPWSLDLIEIVIDNQNSGPPPGGYTDPTGHDSVDQKNANLPTPPPHIVRPPSSPPPSA